MCIRDRGYKSALTGIYKRMAKQELYGGNMSFDFMEKLVQRYDNYNSWEVSNADRAKLYEYDKDDNARYSLATIWAEQYTTIANINNILKNLEEQGAEVLDATLFDIIKGEALGLRAFIYFDLLRLWGPVYSIDPGLKSLPWRDKLSSEQVPLMPAKDVIKHILADLDQAEELLQDDTLSLIHIFSIDYNLQKREHTLTMFGRWDISSRVNNALALTAHGYPNEHMNDFLFGFDMPNRPTGGDSKTRSIGLIGQVSYMYATRYSVDLSLRTDPVSYTHLDVYKRQVPMERKD